MGKVLYPAIRPYSSGLLKVSGLHEIYWEQSGNKNGIPILVLHGGPGGGSQKLYRQYFNPKKFNIIQFDQRGCGFSKPHSELSDNTTIELVNDIEKLRSFLGINSWHLFGGSWGSTLSLIYAILYSKNVNSLTLRGVFLCREEEFLWFYQHGASEMFPEEFDKYQSHIPKEEQEDMIKAYYRRLVSPDKKIRLAAAKHWTRWEMMTSSMKASKSYQSKSEDNSFCDAFARIECHYFFNKIFLEENYILKNISKIVDIPTTIVHGRYDIVCPLKSAWDLHSLLNNSHLKIIEDAGHSIEESGITNALIKATDSII